MKMGNGCPSPRIFTFTPTGPSTPTPVAVHPQGYYLVTYHQGDPRKLYQSFLRVMHYAESHHMTMGKFCFEEYVLGSFNTTQLQDYRTKILIPVL